MSAFSDLSSHIEVESPCASGQQRFAAPSFDDVPCFLEFRVYLSLSGDEERVDFLA
jgi:hypothetical protein